MLRLYVTTTQMLRNYLVNDERGVTAIEYGLIAGIVAVGLVAALVPAGAALQAIFTKISNQLQAAAALIP